MPTARGVARRAAAAPRAQAGAAAAAVEAGAAAAVQAAAVPATREVWRIAKQGAVANLQLQSEPGPRLRTHAPRRPAAQRRPPATAPPQCLPPPP
jgi:hypothetical protein